MLEEENEKTCLLELYLPISLYCKLTETSLNLNLTKSEIIRNALTLFLENPKRWTMPETNEWEKGNIFILEKIREYIESRTNEHEKKS